MEGLVISFRKIDDDLWEAEGYYETSSNKTKCLGNTPLQAVSKVAKIVMPQNPPHHLMFGITDEEGKTWSINELQQDEQKRIQK